MKRNREYLASVLARAGDVAEDRGNGAVYCKIAIVDDAARLAHTLEAVLKKAQEVIDRGDTSLAGIVERQVGREFLNLIDSELAIPQWRRAQCPWLWQGVVKNVLRANGMKRPRSRRRSL